MHTCGLDITELFHRDINRLEHAGLIFKRGIDQLSCGAEAVPNVGARAEQSS